MSKRTLLTLIITHPTFEQERRALESSGQYPLVTKVLKQVEQDLVRDCVMKCVCWSFICSWWRRASCKSTVNSSSLNGSISSRLLESQTAPDCLISRSMFRRECGSCWRRRLEYHHSQQRGHSATVTSCWNHESMSSSEPQKQIEMYCCRSQSLSWGRSGGLSHTQVVPFNMKWWTVVSCTVSRRGPSQFGVTIALSHSLAWQCEHNNEQ